MAIKGLTDRETLKPRLPRLGKLRKGGEKSSKNKPGPDLDYFRFTSDNPDVVRAFYAAYNKQPRVVNAVMFYDSAEENFESWLEAWDASGMVFRSDGENWIVWREGSEYRRGEKPHTDHPDQFEVGRLEVVIPELLAAGYVGTVTLETHSNHDLRNITSVLYAAEYERGSLRGAQFTLRRVEEEISVPGWGDRAGKRSKAKKWLVRLEAPNRMFGGLIDAPRQQRIESGTGEVVDEPQQLPATVSNEKATRPLSPETLRDFMARRLKEQNGNANNPATQPQIGLLASKLEEVFAGQGDEANKRRSVLKYLWGVDSAKELKFGQAKIALDWLIAEKDEETGDYILNSDAVKEAKLVVRSFLVDAGQTELPI